MAHLDGSQVYLIAWSKTQCCCGSVGLAGLNAGRTVMAQVCTLWRPVFITVWFGVCAATAGSLLSTGATVLRDKSWNVLMPAVISVLVSRVKTPPSIKYIPERIHGQQQPVLANLFEQDN